MPKTPKPTALFDKAKSARIAQVRNADPTASWDTVAKTVQASGGYSSQQELKANADAWRVYNREKQGGGGEVASAGGGGEVVASAGGYSPQASGVSPASSASAGQLVSLNSTSPANAWWNGQAYKGGGESEILASSSNALIPHLASGEQQAIAKWIGDNFADFASYKTASITPTAISSDTRNSFFSKDRASQASASLVSMAAASGRQESDLGPGYAFLKKAIGLLDTYGGTVGNGMSRANYAQMQQDFTSLTAGIDSSYTELGRAFLNPSSGGNPLMTSALQNGRSTSGAPNARLFT
jgi:hypothetical protein